jgi:hypothetical protein
MKFTTAEEINQQKSKARHDRTQRLTKDRRSQHGDKNLAATDGLKPIRKEHKGSPIVRDEEFGEIDLRRVRSLRDITSGYNDGSDGL